MNLRLRLARCALMGALLGLLGACGGGSVEQIEPFEPQRLFVFGDEMSVLTKTAPLGRKYSVNALGTDNVAIDCAARPLWTQVLANTFLFAFEDCNPLAVAVPQARVLATPGAKSDDFVAQIEAARASASVPLSSTDLMTVLFGANDVLDLYQNQYVPNPTTATANAITQELTARGARLGQRINELTMQGPKVILSTMPLMGLTPYALREAIDHLDPGRPALLTQFSNAFNTAVRVNIVNDGRFIGLVELDALLNAGVSDPGNYGLTNVTNAVCAVALPDCTTNTLVTAGNATTWLWASELWMGSTAHLNLGNFARGRALGNPF
jgi:hypothetical protein